MKLTVMSATGNVFAVVDAFAEPLPRDLPATAIAVCRARAEPLRDDRSAGAADRRFDGLLVLAPPTEGGDVRMILFNADGSRAEACGNGLRCIARLARERGRATHDEIAIETDRGVRRAHVLRSSTANRPIVGARVAMGMPRMVDERARVSTAWGVMAATLVDMGNPHCVLRVADERPAPVHELGPELEHRFPGRTNVEFVARRGTRLCMRVWERGVGETAGCGTGACAAAFAFATAGEVQFPVEVELPGGVLEIAWDQVGEMQLTGPCEVHGVREWSGPPTEPAAASAR